MTRSEFTFFSIFDFTLNESRMMLRGIDRSGSRCGTISDVEEDPRYRHFALIQIKHMHDHRVAIVLAEATGLQV
jgi:hypothetical protein